jgi:hypothetical protein
MTACDVIEICIKKKTLVEASRLEEKVARVFLANGLETLTTLPSMLYAVV